MSIRSGWDTAAVMPSRPSVATRAAASSIASAMPSSLAQIAATWSCCDGSNGQPAACARSRNNATASDCPASDNGGTWYTRSNGTISRAWLVASMVTRGQVVSSRSSNSATPSTTCSQLSSTSNA